MGFVLPLLYREYNSAAENAKRAGFPELFPEI